MEKEKKDRREAILLHHKSSSRPSSGKTTRPQEIKKLSPNQFALAAEIEQRSTMIGKYRHSSNGSYDNDRVALFSSNTSNGNGKLSPSKTGSRFSSIFLINEASLEIQNTSATPSSRNSSASLQKKGIPLIEEAASIQSSNRKTASEYGIIDISPLGIEFSSSLQSLAGSSSAVVVRKSKQNDSFSHLHSKPKDTKPYVADSNGKPCEWDDDNEPAAEEESSTSYMAYSLRPMSARQGIKMEKGGKRYDLSDSLPQYPDLMPQVSPFSENGGASRNSQYGGGSSISGGGGGDASKAKTHRASVFSYANPLIAKQRKEREQINEQRRKSSVAARRPSTAMHYQSSGVVKDLRSFRRPSTASQVPLPDEWTGKRRQSHNACEISVLVEDLDLN